MASMTGPAATVDDIRKDLQSLKDDVTRLAEQVSAVISAAGDETLNGVKRRFNTVRETIGDAVHDAGERGRDAVTDFSELIGSTVEETVRSRPLATVAVAAARHGGGRARSRRPGRRSVATLTRQPDHHRVRGTGSPLAGQAGCRRHEWPLDRGRRLRAARIVRLSRRRGVHLGAGNVWRDPDVPRVSAWSFLRLRCSP